MKRLLLPLLLSAAALLPGRALAQQKPALNTAPPGTTPPPVRPAPVSRAPAADTANVAPTIPVYTPAPAGQPAPAAPTPAALPQPSQESPSGFELPGREQARKAAQQHADQYTKLFIYSGFGLGYNSFNGIGLFNASISPALGYRLTDRISVGPGFSYAYANYSIGNGYPNVSTSSIGYKAFAQVMVYDGFFVHGEYELTNAQFATDANGTLYFNSTTNQFEKFNQQVRSPLAGIGYRSQFSNRAAADIIVLYNFNDTYNNRLYINPVIRFNFLFNIGH